ncbi:MAG: insulinase family protein [Bdellovibrionales bacterium]|nr:insulinase family protein [Bdellovibrionales bacterium]
MNLNFSYLAILGGLILTNLISPLTQAFPMWEKFSDTVDVILVEKHDRPLVSWMIALPFGTYMDPKGKEGLTYFLGQMLLRGTKNHTRSQIEELLDQMGTSIHISTGSHSFIAQGELLAKNLDPFLSLLSEVLTTPTFEPEEIEKQRQEILGQIQLSLESDASLAKRQFLKSVYPNHPYGNSSIGTRKSVNTISQDDLVDYFKRYVHKGKVWVGAAGSINKTLFQEKSRKLLETLPDGKAEILVNKPSNKLSGLNIFLVDKPDRSQTHFLIGQPSLPHGHADVYALEVFLTAFAGPMFQAQYMNEIRVVRGWSYSAYGTLESRRDSGAWYLYTFPKVADTVPAIQLSLELLEKAAHGNGLTDEAILFAKNYLIRSFPFDVDVPEKVLREKMYNRLLQKPDDELETYQANISKLTIEDIRTAGKKYIDSQNLNIVILGTQTDFKDVQKELGAKSVQVIPYDQE